MSMCMALRRRRRSLSRIEGEAVGLLVSTGSKAWDRSAEFIRGVPDWIWRLSCSRRTLM